jgi:hypothetical protein
MEMNMSDSKDTSGFLSDLIETLGHGYTEENCPILRFWRGLQPLPHNVDCLAIHASSVQRNLALLDDAPRHDSILSDELLTKINTHVYDLPFHRVHNRLKVSLSVIDEAFSSLKNVFRGDLKVKYYERLARHRAEAQNLIALFSEMPDDGANQPFAIRQNLLAPLYHHLTDVLDQLTPLRRSVMDDTLPGTLFAELKEAEAELFRLRAAVAKWRDNPSQKLGKKMGHCVQRLEALRLTFARLNQNGQYECQQIGIKFYNRAGLNTVTSC